MMKKMFAAGALVVVLAVGAQAESWMVDVAHSTIGFSVRHLVISKTKGYFRDFEGMIEFDGKDLEKGSVQLSAKVASIDTDNEKRDNHLRSADFFDAKTYQTISFKSKKVVIGKGDEFKLVGDLTIRGVTREVTFDCEFNGVATGPMGNTRAGFSAETTINRQDFGVKWNKTMEAGGFVVGNDVEIALEVEIIQMSEEMTSK